MIAAALSWAERGFAVFPLKPRDKVPFGSFVPHGVKGASRDRAVIIDWWRREPKANIGARTGGGMFVVDLDGDDAVAWFTNSCARHGGAPRTLTVKTAKGFHVYFSADGEVPNNAGRLAPGVDVRGEGGYVVAAPSIHPSGHVYAIARDLPVAEAPRWLVDLAMPEQRPRPVVVTRGEPWATHRDMRTIPGIIAFLANAREGERNRIAFWAACRLHEMVCKGSITRGLADQLLREAGARCGLPGMEILRTAASAARTGGRCG